MSESLVAALVAALAAVGAALVAHLELGGRKELREMTTLVAAATQLSEADPLRAKLLKDASRAQRAYRQRTAARPRMLLAVGLGTTVLGLALLGGAATSPATDDEAMPYAVAVAATVGFVIAMFGCAFAAISLPIAVWLESRHGPGAKSGLALVTVLVVGLLVFFTTRELIGLPDLLGATTR